jgi:hypothetical protein
MHLSCVYVSVTVIASFVPWLHDSKHGTDSPQGRLRNRNVTREYPLRGLPQAPQRVCNAGERQRLYERTHIADNEYALWTNPPSPAARLACIRT